MALIMIIIISDIITIQMVTFLNFAIKEVVLFIKMRKAQERNVKKLITVEFSLGKLDYNTIK